MTGSESDTGRPEATSVTKYTGCIVCFPKALQCCVWGGTTSSIKASVGDTGGPEARSVTYCSLVCCPKVISCCIWGAVTPSFKASGDGI